MSWSALAWAVRQKLPSTQKLVLLMLAERHNGDSGQCNPSHDLLAEDCGLSRRSVVDQIGKLEEAGYLRVLHRARGNAKLPNQYVLNLHFGVPEKVKNIPDDPFLVVNDVHMGSEPFAQGVVNDVHKGSERAAHKPGIEPGIEPNTKKIPKSRAAKPEVEKPEGVTDTTWSDWLAHRKAKRAPVTQTALDNIASEAAKASYTLEDALKTCCARGWQGFCADWVQPRHQAQPQAPRQLQSFAERDREEQMQRWERATGRVHPDRQQHMPRNVIDITPRGETMFLES
ncbi:helix-turn-helix domain-containing protein [Comamonas testosteroni]|uniref:Helix-turn-helix domain-containing protein n=1 Tax=Comamonas testosteroni TaxID=285 RepID=A0A096GM58_COMTE|nr:helix-turn-helix domain-containing protein [Comamonas testosteroni]KGH26285.1 hypothetical protein P353_22405 [Comamonas testosteroni]